MLKSPELLGLLKMILYDISSAFHMCVHRLANQFANGDKIDLKDYRKEFYMGMLWILDHHQNMFRNYGEPVICMDDKSDVSWRKKFYPNYKAQRKKIKDSQTSFDYNDAYIIFDEFLNALKECGIKVIGVPEAEADDIILVLGHFLASNQQEVMILSPDKDFIQLQTSPRVQQYSWFTRKMVSADDKTSEGGMKDWILEHICLGDQTDAVPRIIDFRKFRPGVEEYLSTVRGFHGTPLEFSNESYLIDDFANFGGIWETEKFGPAALKKKIKEFGSIKNWIDSDSHIRSNFERNFKLVMREGIPDYLKDKILEEYKKPVKEDFKKLADKLGIETTDLPEFMKSKIISSDVDFLKFLDF